MSHGWLWKRPLRHTAGLIAAVLVLTMHAAASARPQLLARGTTTGAGWPITAALGDLRAVSDGCLFFLSLSESVSPTGPIMEEGKSFFRVLTTNRERRQVKVHGLRGDSVVSFFSDTKASVWGVDWHYGAEKSAATLKGQIFDCQAMRPLKNLQAVPLDEHAQDWKYAEARGFRRGRNILFVGDYEAFEWSLDSGRLRRRWSLWQPKDDAYTTNTVYIPRSDVFLQIMAARIRVWNAKTGRLTHTSPKLANFDLDYGEGDSPGAVEFSPDGRFIAYDTVLTDGSSGPHHVARCDTGQTLWKIQGQAAFRDGYLSTRLGVVRFSSDSRKVFFWSENAKRFTVCDARSGRVLQHLQGPTSVDRFWVSSDGRNICSTSVGNVWRQRID